jgi:hypothetical protein
MRNYSYCYQHDKSKGHRISVRIDAPRNMRETCVQENAGFQRDFIRQVEFMVPFYLCGNWVEFLPLLCFLCVLSYGQAPAFQGQCHLFAKLNAPIYSLWRCHCWRRDGEALFSIWLCDLFNRI